MKRLFLFLLFLGLVGPPVWAAGTCTVSDVTSSQNASSRVPDAGAVIVTVTCTGDASTGSFPSTTIPLTGSYPSGSILNSYNLTGYYLYQVGRTPGSPNPTANYTVTVTDSKSFALDMGLLTGNGSASAAQMTAIALSGVSYPIVRSALTLAITGNSVNSAKITIDLIFRAADAATASAPVATFRGTCANAVAISATGNGGAAIDLLGGAVSNGGCNGTVVGANAGAVSTSACTVTKLAVHSSAGGAGAGDGIFTVMVNHGGSDTASAVTCTTGTATSCIDTAHAAAVVAGDLVWVRGYTTGTNLANLSAAVECN